MSTPQATPTRSSLKGKGPRSESQGKRSVSFMSDLLYSRGPSTAPSTLSRSFGPINEQPQNETIQTLKQVEDDPNDIDYTTTDEEQDEFENEPYENEPSPGPEDESDDGIFFEDTVVDPEEEEYDYEDTYLLEEDEPEAEKRAFVPMHDLQRTPKPAKSTPASQSTTVRKRVDSSNPVTILRRNMDNNLRTLQRENQSLPPLKSKVRKGKVKISSDGSPQLENTPDAQLRRQMNERDTPSGPARSGFGSALETPGSFMRARRNLNDEFLDGRVEIPAGHPPSFPANDPVSHLSPLQVITFNVTFFLCVLLGIFVITNRSEGLQKISNLPKSFSYAVNNPEQIIPGISATVATVPQFIICSIIPCESTSRNRLKTITMIATDTTLDLTSISQFADSLTALGKPLILNSVGNSLTAEIKDESTTWRDSATIKAMEHLAHDYQDAHLDLRLLVGASQNFIRLTAKRWVDFSGFLTDQIPRESREEIDLPAEWRANIPATRRKYPAKSLKKYYRVYRKEMVLSYQYLHLITERSEKSLKDILKRTREIHEAGIYESTGVLEILEPLVKSVCEIRKSIAFQIKFFGSDDEVPGESLDEDFTFGTLKWKMESLWTSVTILQDAATGRVVKSKPGQATVR